MSVIKFSISSFKLRFLHNNERIFCILFCVIYWTFLTQYVENWWIFINIQYALGNKIYSLLSGCKYVHLIYYVACVLLSLLVFIHFTFLSLSMVCQSLLMFVCFCLLAFPEVSALGRWLICRKFPSYLFCELWPLPL